MGPAIPGSIDYKKLRLKGGLGSLLFNLRAHRVLMQKRAVVMNFHRVDNRLKGNPIACTVSEFRAYCDFFANHFNVVFVTDLLNRMREGLDIGGCLAITFDDGYLDNLELAVPELEKRKLPAAFFIASGMIGTKTQPWWDRDFGAEAVWMNWSQVRELHASGFEIGAHTVNHVDLGKAHGFEAKKEIEDSKKRLEDELNDEVKLFSYPFGRRHQITEENRALVKAAGFDCCFSAYGGLIEPKDDLFALQRAPVTPWHVSPGHLGFELMFRS